MSSDELILEIHSNLASLCKDVALLRADLLGNGQPGRVVKLEEDVQDLQQGRAKVMGIVPRV